MTDRYENIRRALEMGPTPGPWRPSYDKGSTRDIFTEHGKLPVCMVRGVTYVGQEQYLANGHFIAACDPDTLRALLEERDVLRDEVERLRARAAELERDARLGAVVRSEVANTNTYGHVPALDLAVRADGARERGDYAVGYLLRAIADALRAEEGGEHG